MARTKKFTDAEIIAALKKTKGLVYLAADKIGCHVDTIYERVKKSKEVAATVKHERGKFVDTAEQKLYNAVIKCQGWAIQTVLKCLGKDRGYVENHKHEHSGTDGGPIQFQDISDDDLDRRIAALESGANAATRPVPG